LFSIADPNQRHPLTEAHYKFKKQATKDIGLSERIQLQRLT